MGTKYQAEFDADSNALISEIEGLRLTESWYGMNNDDIEDYDFSLARDTEVEALRKEVEHLRTQIEELAKYLLESPYNGPRDEGATEWAIRALKSMEPFYVRGRENDSYRL